MEKNEMERFEFLDFFKGVAIFLVVLGHVYLKCLGIQTLFFKLITDFHMPFWFMLSGFMAYKLSNRDICLSIKKKTISLLLPFCTCGGFYALGCGEMHQYLCSEFHAGYWFLLSLFLCWILFIPFLKLLNYIPENKYKYWIEIFVLLIPYWLMSIIGHFVPAKFWIVSTFSMSVSYYRFLVLGFFLGRMVLATEFMPKLRKYYDANVFIACSFAICGGGNFSSPFP